LLQFGPLAPTAAKETTRLLAMITAALLGGAGASEAMRSLIDTLKEAGVSEGLGEAASEFTKDRIKGYEKEKRL
jgi:hypothetical protein